MDYKYRIMYEYPGEYPEEIDTAGDIKEANYLVNEYTIAFHNVGKVYKKKVSKPNRPKPEFNI
jgi:hypothetical protein